MINEFNMYNGLVKVKPEHTEDVIDLLEAFGVEDAFVGNNVFAKADTHGWDCVWIMGDNPEANVYGALDAIAGTIMEGSIEFSGEGHYWKRMFNPASKKWKHLAGHLCYTAEDCRNAFPELNEVAVYKEYTDNCPYETEEIRVYPNRQKAVDHLMSEVENYLDMPWEEIEEEYGDDGENDIDDDFVKIRVRDDDRAYFVVEDHTIEK